MLSFKNYKISRTFGYIIYAIWFLRLKQSVLQENNSVCILELLICNMLLNQTLTITGFLY